MISSGSMDNSNRKKSSFTAIFIMMCIGHFFVDFSLGIWPIWKTIAGYPLVEAGIASGIAVFFGECMQGFFSLWADRGYCKPLLAVGVSVAALSLFLPISHSLIESSAILLCSCLGSSAFHPTSVGVAASLPFKTKHIRIAIFHTCGLLGLAVSQITFISLYEKAASAPFFLFVVPLLITALFLYIKAPKEGDLFPHAPHRERAQFSTFLAFFKRAELRKIYLLLFLNQTMAWAILFLLPDVLKEKGCPAHFSFGIGHCIYILGAAFACIPLGILASRLDAALIIFISTLISIIAFFFTITATSASYILIIALFILGGSIGAVPPLALAIGNELESKNRAMISAFLMGFVWIFSDASGYILSAYSASFFSEHAATYGLSIMGLFLILGIIPSFSLWRYTARRQVEINNNKYI